MEITEKYKTFSVPIEKEVTEIDKDGNESVAIISWNIKFIDSARFNGMEGIRKIKCKDCDCILEYENVENNLVKDKSLSCNKDYLNKLAKKIKKWLKKPFRFSNSDMLFM